MTRFSQLPVRVQKLAVGLFAALLVVAGAGASWAMHERVAAAQSRLVAGRANRAAMGELVARYEARQLSGAASDLSALVTRSLQGRNFQPSLIQQQNGELALRFDAVPFDAVLAWMFELEEAGAVLSNVALAQSPSGGVTLTLVLRGG